MAVATRAQFSRFYLLRTWDVWVIYSEIVLSLTVGEVADLVAKRGMMSKIRLA